jgi:heme exporter protein C
MITVLANPQRFLAFSRVAAPILGVAAVVLGLAGLWTGWGVPDDYQQGATVRIMFIHLPSVFTGMMAYVCLAASAFFGLVFRHSLADAAAKAVAPLGAAFTFLGLLTGSFWGRPMWGAWWVWDARLTSVLVLFFLYCGHIALVRAFDDPSRGYRAGAILALIGVVNLPIIKFSVDWWNTLHQPATIGLTGAPTMHIEMLWPLLVSAIGYSLIFISLVLSRTRSAVRERRIRGLLMARAEQHA